MRVTNTIVTELKHHGYVVFFKIECNQIEFVRTKSLNTIQFFLFSKTYKYLPRKIVKYLGVDYEQIHEI